jgi:2-C-methyl-D-erythritol 4-phosphate cytidylyltransferase
MGGGHFAIVPAAGSGSRFGAAKPKQYSSLAGRSMLEHAVRALARHPSIECTFVVLAPGDRDFSVCDWDAQDRNALGGAVAPLYCGGPTRACSVFNALVALRGCVEPQDWILVHDAARPCLSRAELDRLLREIGADDVGGLLALPVTDTLKCADPADRVVSTQPRDALWRALTPQMFRYGLLVEALYKARSSNPTDESAAIEALGLRPRLVPGAATNIKVTYPEDIALAAQILASRAEDRCG